jgi:hypothetical protein
LADVEDALSELFAQPLDQFVSTRDALAKALRAQGDRDDAATIKAIRKPSKLAWTLNEAGRRAPGELRAYVDAVHATTQAQAIGGPVLRDRARELREAATALSRVAASLPTASATAPDALTALLAVATDGGSVEALERGRLGEVPEPAGLGPLPEDGVELASSDDDPAARRASQARDRARAKELASAERRVARAEQRAERTQKELDSARSAYDSARDELDAARAELDSLR